MRDEYDLSGGEKGKFFGKVDTKNPVVIVDEDLGEAFDEELLVLESNLSRIKALRKRISELDSKQQETISARIVRASEELDEIALSR